MENSSGTVDTRSPSKLFGDLPLLKLRFQVRHFDGSVLSEHKGSAWRGLIGWELRRLVCPFDRRPDCRRCTIHEYCPYFLLFEDRSAMPGLSDSPRGYVIYAPADDQVEMSELNLTLFGHCTKFLPVFIKAVFDGQSAGLGYARNPYEVLSVVENHPDGHERSLSGDPDDATSVNGPFTLRTWIEQSTGKSDRNSIYLMSPLRLRKKKKYLTDMDWPFFFSCLVRRLENLNCIFNNGAPMGKLLWQKIKPCFNEMNPGGTFSWKELRRYSNRQRRKVPMGGIIGNAQLNGVSGVYLEWLHAASLVHVGKGASMGLGKIDLQY